MTQTKEKNITISLKNITKNFEKITAVNDVSLNICQGEIVALLGPNGAGKSTLMNMMAGYLSPSSGEIFINNTNIALNDIHIKKDIGFLSEGAPMYGDMSVKLFLQYLIELKLSQDTLPISKQLYKNELERIIAVSKIEDVISQKIETLSKGYLRRVGFAQSIIGNPPILLLDEPTDGLDPNQKEHIRKLIVDMKKEKTILISTHLLEEAETIATRIILVNKGQVVANGTVKDILAISKKKTLADAFKVLTSTKGEQV